MNYSKIFLTAVAMGAGAFTLSAQNPSANPPANTNDSSGSYNNQESANGTTNGTTMSTNQENATTSQTMNAGPATAALDTDNVVQNLNQTSFDNRDEAIKNVKSHLDKGNASVAKLEVKDFFHKMSSEEKDQYKTAKANEKSAHAELKSRIKDAENCSQDNWNQNRQALAQAYQNYSEAVSRLESFGPGQTANETENTNSTQPENTNQTGGNQSLQR